MKYFLNKIIFASSTHLIPEAAINKITPIKKKFKTGDLIFTEVQEVGDYDQIETKKGDLISIKKGDVLGLICSKRYATQAYHASLPQSPNKIQLVSLGGVAGTVIRENSVMQTPTKLSFVGLGAGEEKRALNTFQFVLSPPSNPKDHIIAQSKIILIVGSDMDVGKTNSAATIIEVLTKENYKIHAGKITGTSRFKDIFLFKKAGAQKILDFSWFGHPSTYGLSRKQLNSLFLNLFFHLSESQPDYIVLELADGLLQKETAELLLNIIKKNNVQLTIMNAKESISALEGVCLLKRWGYKNIAISGKVTNSRLAIGEVQDKENVPHFSSIKIDDFRKKYKTLLYL